MALTLAALSFLASMVHVWMASQHPDADPQLESVYSQYLVLFFVSAGLRLLAGEFPIRRVLHRLDFNPAQTVATGFAAVILIGTLLLSVPLAVGRLETVSVLDALFTATSAVTVTGLSVYDIGTFYTAWGQWVILLLIQVGGLGTMAASASLVVLAGRRLRLRAAASLRESMDLQTVGQVSGQIRTIFWVTVAAEGMGALLLYWRWVGHAEVENAAFAAAFHAVAAFCNAGFSTFSLNLVPFQTDWPTIVVIGGLIVLGGLGFPLFHHFATVARFRWQ
jgi:trk system potassium uptake protein TrkH